MKHRKFYIIILIALFLTSCNFKAFENKLPFNNTKVYDNAVLGLDTVDTFNPLRTESEDYYYFSHLIYDSLFDYDNEGNIRPELVEKYDLEDNILRFTLKEKNFHNGEEFTAEDVLFTLNAIRYAYINFGEDYLSSFLMPVSNIRRAEIIDEREMLIEFNQNYIYNLSLLTFPVFSKKDFSDENSENYEKALSEENFSPNGTGNYEVEKILDNGMILKGSGGAIVRNLDVKFFDSEEKKEQAFVDGRINLFYSPKKYIDKFDKMDKIYLKGFSSNKCSLLAFNEESSFIQGKEGKDLKKIIYSVLRDMNIPVKVYMNTAQEPNFSFYSIENSSNYLEKDDIKNILQKYYKDNDEDGFLEDEEGRKLFLRIIVNDDDYRKKVCELLKEELKNIGIELEVLVIGEDIDYFGDGEYLNLLNGVSNLQNCDMLYLGAKFSYLNFPDFMNNIVPESKVYSFVSKDTTIQSLIKEYEICEESEREAYKKKIAKRFDETLPYIFLTIEKDFIYSNIEMEFRTPFFYRRYIFLEE